MGPAIFAFPDGFTSLGGNQYVDTPVLGRWDSYLREELLPQLEQRFRVRPGASNRAVFGKSSGGYGALVQGLHHGESWGAVACHSADMAFDWCYRGDFPKTLTALARHDGSIRTFLESVGKDGRIDSGDFHALMTLAMAASYDPDPAEHMGIRLPMDPHTCEVDPQRWRQWLQHDPVELIEREACQKSLGALRLFYIDCGSRDEYNLQYGARTFVAKLERFGIQHHYEEFDGTHSGTEHRLDRSLPMLFEALDG